MSTVAARSVAPCAWCGLLTEAGPACSICGSPVVDIAGSTTTLRVSWPLDPPFIRLEGPGVEHRWVTLGQAARLFGVPEQRLRTWVNEAPGDRGEMLLLIEPGVPSLPRAIWSATQPRPVDHAKGEASEDAALSLVPRRPDGVPLEIPRLPIPDLTVPSLWAAPMPVDAPARLGAAWAFQPTEGARRAIRLEMLRVRGATVLAVGLGAAGAVYLLDRAFR